MSPGTRDSGSVSSFGTQWLWGLGEFPTRASVSLHKPLSLVTGSSPQGGCAREMGGEGVPWRGGCGTYTKGEQQSSADIQTWSEVPHVTRAS